MKPINIFKTGTHTAMNGTRLNFSEADLHAIAKAYNPTVHEAPIVVGHPKSDTPAYGWIKSIGIENGNLYAEPHQIDPAFAEMVSAGRYKKVSAAFYTPGSSSNPTPDTFHLRHVGFLGAQPPAVKGLKEAEFGEGDELLVFEFAELGDWTLTYVLESIGGLFKRLRDGMIDKDGLEKADELLPSWQIDDIERAAGEARANAADATSSSFSEKPALSSTPDITPSTTPSTTKELDMNTDDEAAQDAAQQQAALKAEADAIAAREAALKEKEAAFAETEARRAAEAAIEPLIQAGKILPAERDGMVGFMAGLSAETDSLAFGEGDGAVKTSPRAFMEGFLEKLDARVEFSETSAHNGSDLSDGTDAKAIATAALAYQEQQRRDGVVVTTTDAVLHIKKGAGK